MLELFIQKEKLSEKNLSVIQVPSDFLKDRFLYNLLLSSTSCVSLRVSRWLKQIHPQAHQSKRTRTNYLLIVECITRLPSSNEMPIPQLHSFLLSPRDLFNFVNTNIVIMILLNPLFFISKSIFFLQIRGLCSMAKIGKDKTLRGFFIAWMFGPKVTR